MLVDEPSDDYRSMMAEFQSSDVRTALSSPMETTLAVAEAAIVADPRNLSAAAPDWIRACAPAAADLVAHWLTQPALT